MSNNKPYVIMEAGCKLVYMQKGGKLEETSPMPLPWVKDNGYTWSKKKLDRKEAAVSKRILVVAQWNKQGAWIETRVSNENREEGRISLEVDTDYKIRLQWFGAIDGRGLDTCIREYWLEYNGEKVELKETK